MGHRLVTRCSGREATVPLASLINFNTLHVDFSDPGLQERGYRRKVSLGCSEVTFLRCQFLPVPGECVSKAPVSECIRAQSYAERLRLGLAVMHGEAPNFELVMSDGPRSTLPTGLTRARTGLELPRKQSKAAECLLTSLCFFG